MYICVCVYIYIYIYISPLWIYNLSFPFYESMVEVIANTTYESLTEPVMGNMAMQPSAR